MTTYSKNKSIKGLQGKKDYLYEIKAPKHKKVATTMIFSCTFTVSKYSIQGKNLICKWSK